jgi:hypothetical protein
MKKKLLKSGNVFESIKFGIVDIPWWKKILLWFRPWIITSDITIGISTTVYCKELWGIIYVLKVV